MSPDTVTLERQILGTILRDPTLYSTAESLRLDDVDDPTCKDVWGAIQALAHSTTPLSIQTVVGSCLFANAEEVEAISRHGHADRDRLATTVTTLINARRTAALEKDLVKQLGALRQEGEWQKVTSDLLTAITADYGGYKTRSGQSVRAAAIEKLRRAGSDLIPTGLKYLDDHLSGGLRGAMLVGVGAYAKTGKTTLVASISGNLEIQQVPHLVFTLERHETHIEELKEARSLGVNHLDLNTKLPELEARAVTRSYAEYIHSRSITIEEIRHEILYAVRRKNCRVVLIDYWQLIAASAKGLRGETREAELARQAQILQATTIDAGVPIILTCQLNEGGAPRESHAIKFSANLFLVMHRDPNSAETWFENIVSNCSEPTNVGSISDPALIFRHDVGPFFDNP